MVDEKLYISGGSRNGRYLSDVQVFNLPVILVSTEVLSCGSCDNDAIFQVFDLRSLAWSALKLKTESNADKVEENNLQEVFPATSGHNMVKVPFFLFFFYILKFYFCMSLICSYNDGTYNHLDNFNFGRLSGETNFLSLVVIQRILLMV